MPSHSHGKVGRVKLKPGKATIVDEGLSRGGKKHAKIRWAKGHSSDSNPSLHRHRDLARSRFQSYQVASSATETCTVEEAADVDRLHHALERTAIDDDAASERLSLADSERSALTGITNCTNPTFDKIHRLWKSGSLLHKDILAVLGAITDVIRAQGGKENEIEYFAALLASLSTGADDGTLAATVYLLNLTMRKIAHAMLRKRFEQIAEVLFTILSKEREEESPTLRHAIAAIGFLLSVQTSQVWSAGSLARKSLDAVLTFVGDARPHVRKAAQKAVMLVMCSAEPDVHPAAKVVADYCIERLEKAGLGKKTNDEGLHVLNLVGSIVHGLPQNSLKALFDTVFRLMNVSKPIVTAVALKAFHSLFLHKPSDTILPATLNAQIILALYDFKPTVSDARANEYWLAALAEAHECLLGKSRQLCAGYSLKFVDVLLDYIANPHDSVSKTAADAFSQLITTCFADFVTDCTTNSESRDALERCIRKLLACLNVHYYQQWPVILHLIETFFGVLNDAVLPAVGECLRALAELRETSEFAYTRELDGAIGAAIRSCGAAYVLEVLPLGVNVDAPVMPVDVARSWLLPLLRRMRRPQLEYFTTVFLPLAVRIRKRVSDEFELRGAKVEAKVYGVVQAQIWELLPAFCKDARDVDVALPKLAPMLGSALIERGDLRLCILNGLRVLIADAEKESKEDERVTTVGRYAKNFLPILFNLYTREVPTVTTPGYDERGVRLAVLETVRAYLKITTLEQVKMYADVALKKVNDVETSGERKAAIMDVLIACIAHLDEEMLASVFDTVVRGLDGGELDARIQKKTVRVLQEMCTSESDACRVFVERRLAALKGVLVASGSAMSPATKACRLAALRCVFTRIDTRDDEFVRTMLPQVVLALREPSIKAKRAAAATLVVIVEHLVRVGTTKDVGSAFAFIGEVLRPFTAADATVAEASAMLIAARVLVYEFRNDLAAATIGSLVSVVVPRVGDERRPVVRAALEFFSTLVGVCSAHDVTTLRLFADVFLPPVFAQADDCRRHFRFLTRKLLVKFAKRCGVDALAAYVPSADEGYAKQLAYVRKLVKREEAKKTAAALGAKTGTATNGDEEESDGRSTIISKASSWKTNYSKAETIAELLRDSSDEEEEDSSAQRREKDASAALWLVDDEDGRVVDLLDQSALARHVRTTGPPAREAKEPSKGTARCPFKTAPDGRLIITTKGVVDDEDAGTTERAQGVTEDGDDDEEEEAVFAAGGKRKRAIAQGADRAKKAKTAPSTAPSTASSYKSGGKGIHRSIASSTRGGDARRKGSKFEPYTYVPLELRTLNKRNAAKFAGRFRTLVGTKKRKGANKKNARAK